MKNLIILMLLAIQGAFGQTASPTITWNSTTLTVDGVDYSIVGNFITDFPCSEVSFTLFPRCNDPADTSCDQSYYGLTSDGDYFYMVNGQYITNSNMETLLYGGSQTMIIDLLTLDTNEANGFSYWYQTAPPLNQSRTFSCLNMMWSESSGTYEVCGRVNTGTMTREICEQVPSMIWIHSDPEVPSTYTIAPAPWPLQSLFIATIRRADADNPSINYIGRTEEEVHTAIRNDIQN